MSLDIVPLQSIERGQLGVMRARGAVMALVLVAVAVTVELVLADELPVRGLALGVAIVLGAWTALVSPPRKWRRWGYAFTGSELHVAYGWWTQVHTIVPVSRVQHIDVSQGPLERMFGVARLALHTAGTDAALVVVIGLKRETAEEIRDAIRARIGSDR